MIYVIRHGQTDRNKEGRLQGRQGLPLNDSGIKQAEWVRDHLRHIPFDYVFSSPQERALQTAQIITGKPPITDPRLDVFDLGEADGLTKAEVKMAGAVPDPGVYEGVEDVDGFVRRVFAFMHELEKKYGLQQAHILLSGHRCTTGCIGAYFEGLPKDGNLLKLSSDNGQYKTYSFRSLN
ncbi:histidine phosphatase family protein [Paenibacillus sp. 32352]|uniref:histidine phosphatase family protein n=1 Tax=Paenibacillus sp. 32352 TaxID=1969111 RepID=UPI0009AEC784|nr:histidine phosphatase family protein [Paenibacillus sp. 32352]